MIRFIYNLIYTIFYSIWCIIITIITGKMSKVSAYHSERQLHDVSLIDVTDDMHIKTNNTSLVTNEAKEKIISDFIEHLINDDNFTNPINETNFPIFNGSEIIGSTTVNNIINKSLKNYTNKLK